MDLGVAVGDSYDGCRGLQPSKGRRSPRYGERRTANATSMQKYEAFQVPFDIGIPQRMLFILFHSR
jgi:hypothetical protein